MSATFKKSSVYSSIMYSFSHLSNCHSTIVPCYIALVIHISHMNMYVLLILMF